MTETLVFVFKLKSLRWTKLCLKDPFLLCVAPIG